MFHLKFPKRRSVTITAVAEDVDTLESLAHYLRRRVSFNSARDLDHAFTTSAASDVVLFYPDGFSVPEVYEFALRVLGNTTLSLVVVVTGHPERFNVLLQASVMVNRLIVLAKPAWPWELFATIQSGLPSFGRQSVRAS
jgi:hypothetical protein